MKTLCTAVLFLVLSGLAQNVDAAVIVAEDCYWSPWVYTTGSGEIDAAAVLDAYEAIGDAAQIIPAGCEVRSIEVDPDFIWISHNPSVVKVKFRFYICCSGPGGG